MKALKWIGTFTIVVCITALANAQSTMSKTKDKVDEKASQGVNNVIDHIFSGKKKKKSDSDDTEKVATKTSKTESTKQEEKVPAQKSAVENGKYVTYYQNLIIGDQQNEKYGQFFIPSKGICVNVDAAQKMQSKVGIVFFKGYAGSQILTFPGNAKEAATFESVYNEIALFTEETGGVDAWEQANVNSGDIEKCNMSEEKFESITGANTWKAFNTAFITANGGSNKLGRWHSANPENGTVYLVKFSNSLRAIILAKNVIAPGGKGGSVKFDVIVEEKGN